MIYIENLEASYVNIQLFDLFGRKIIDKVVNSNLFPYQIATQDIAKLVNGLYYLDISFDKHQIRTKIMKTSVR